MCVQQLGIGSLQNVLVQHCKHAFGLKLTLADSRVLVFSGDTQRCQNVIDAAHGAHLLVHEATFEAGMEEDAAHKKHSTIADAVDVRSCATCI